MYCKNRPPILPSGSVLPSREGRLAGRRHGGLNGYDYPR
jgi:hypothetical protein